jgi:TonB family protein
MVTRAFLLCGDEKAVHAISQILDELEVSFEHSSEPPFALKRLPAQRFDLLIVDCDNPQNATQFFNSARASNLNKNSIAIAIVEGKAGVPNAFRLGASLVLTKPVSLEQARNTLRTGVGMTKKDAPEAKSATAVPATPHAAVSHPPAALVPAPISPAPLTPVVSAPAPHAPSTSAAAPTPMPPTHSVAPVPAASVPPPVAKIPAAPLVPAAPVPATTGVPALSTPIAIASVNPKPALSAVAEKPVLAPKAPSIAPPPAPETKPAVNTTTDSKAQPSVATAAVAKAVAAAAGTASTATDAVSTSASAGKADIVSSASTTDKKGSVEEKKSPELTDKSGPVLKIEDPLADELDSLDPLKDHGVPSFGAMSREPFAGLDADKPKRSKAPLVAALLLILLGGGAYAAWTTQPNFRALMIWEYGNVGTKIDALRGKAPIAASAKPQHAPVAVQAPAPSATPNSENIDLSMTSPAAANDTASPATANSSTPSAEDPASTNAPPATSTASSTKTTSEPAAPTASKTDSTKQPKLQAAKQDTGKSATNAALVPASLPPATAAKAPVSDLLEVSEDFADDQVIHRVHPTYPKQALAKKLHGNVVLQVIVSKQGKVDSLALISGDPMLGQAAQSAVKQWRYKPYWHNGEPTDFQTRVTVDFKLP